MTTMPHLRIPIEQKIWKDPRILEARIEDQFRELVVKPLAHQEPLPPPEPPKSSSRQKKSRRKQKGTKKSGKSIAVEGEDPRVQTKLPYVVIIDGLDECADEQTQKRILSII